MPRGDWSKRLTPKLVAAFVVVLMAILVGFGGVVRGLVEQTEYERRAYESSQKYTADTYGPAYDACVGLAGDGQSDCIAKANNEWRENERKEQDLVAQQTTAIWTFLMGLAAIVGVTLSALGIYLVWTTFRETRDANNIAKMTAYRQLRPYVYFDHASFETQKPHVRVVGGGLANIFIKNYGQTPAYDATITVSKRALNYPLDPNIKFEPQTLEVADQVIPPGHAHHVTAGFGGENVVGAMRGEKCLTVSIAVHYKFWDESDKIVSDSIAQTFIFTKHDIEMDSGRTILPSDYAPKAT